MKGSRFTETIGLWPSWRLASPSAARQHLRRPAGRWQKKCWQHRWPSAVESYVDSGLVGGGWLVGLQKNCRDYKKLEGFKIQQKTSIEFVKLVGPNVEIRVFCL